MYILSKTTQWNKNKNCTNYYEKYSAVNAQYLSPQIRPQTTGNLLKIATAWFFCRPGALMYNFKWTQVKQKMWLSQQLAN